MIPKEHINNQKKHISWTRDYMVEQDMIISRALVDMYQNKDIRENLVFRGGTALNKLFLKPPLRYSEDIDCVLVQEQPVGFLMDAIKKALHWLGKAHTKRDRYGFKVLYAFENVDGGKSKLKIETNATESVNFNGLKEIPFAFESDWWRGSSTIISYDLEELMATKLRALYQRRKGRDLFDIWYVFSKGLVDIDKVTKIFQAYNAHKGVNITKKMFAQNMEAKQDHTYFRQDIHMLLPSDTAYDFDVAFDFFMREVVPRV